jgi:phosphoesterase RecJ-like protein
MEQKSIKSFQVLRMRKEKGILMSDWNKICSILSESKEVIILVHEKADGDSLGSALALALSLQEMGINTLVLYPEETPLVYRFLPGMEMFKTQTARLLPENVPVIAVDCADKKRVLYDIPPSNTIINIDHHISNDYFGTYNIVDTDAAAAGEIIYRIFKDGGVRISPDMATCLYVAISTDTGSFTYSNTTSQTMRIASELLDLGSDISLIREQLYEKRPLKELLTIKAALENLFISEDGKLISCILDIDTMKKEDILGSDTDGLIGLMRATDGVEVALLFKEIEIENTKVSMRSKSYVDVNEIARQFRGGGHARAAGCTIKGNIREVRDSVIKKVTPYLTGGEIK